MTASSASLSIYQLRLVLRGISPLTWRRLLVRSDTTRVHLHTILQIVCAWGDEHLHRFHIHGREYSSRGAQTRHVLLSDLCLHGGERFRYVYDFMDNWECDISLEAFLPQTSHWVYPLCISGKHTAPPEDCQGAWPTWNGMISTASILRSKRWGVADAISTLLNVDAQTSVRAALGDLEELREAVDCLDTYQQFQPDYFDRRKINAQLQSRRWYGEETP